MNFYRVGNSYRGTIHCGAGPDALIGIIPATSAAAGTPRLVALPRLKTDAPDAIEPSQALATVAQALRDVATATGVTIAVDAIEYVPNDSPHYDLLYGLAREVATRLAKNEEFPTSR